MPEDDETQVVVTGLGAVCALARNVPTLWSAVLEGRGAAGPVPEYAPPPTVAAEAAAHLDRPALFALDASLQALADARLPLAADTASQVALVLGSAFGPGTETATKTDDGPPVSSLTGQVAGALGVRGPTLGISAGGAGGTLAIGLAAEMIRRGDAVVALAGGCDTPLRSDVQSRLAGAGLLSSSRSCRPLDANRDGALLSEGGAILLLERLDVAQGRGAPIYAEVAGFGASSGAIDANGLLPDPVAAGAALQRSLSHKPLLQGEIDAYWAWAPGHNEQDALETQAIHRVFGRSAFQLYVTAFKGSTGHLAAGSGALEAALAAMALREGIIPPANGCETPDPQIGLDIVRGEPRRDRLGHVMCYAYGLGGHHACLILGRFTSGG